MDIVHRLWMDHTLPAHKGQDTSNLKKRREIGIILGKRIATNLEVIDYELSVGRKVIEVAKQENVSVQEFLDRKTAIQYLRSLFKSKDIAAIFNNSFQGCINGKNHMAHTLLMIKFLDFAFGDPKKFGLDEKQTGKTVTIKFSDSIEVTKKK